ncbi:MAG: agmatinase family protein [Alphaproteobacteria bacterium]|nr:agmatinase family protein [Alphaproteobacteria bacterium]
MLGPCQEVRVHTDGSDQPGFDPDGPGAGEGLFGLDGDPRAAAVQVIPVPWEATASYGRGTRHGPAAVLRASGQVDLSDPDFGEAWRHGIGLLDLGAEIDRLADQVEADALAVIDSGGTLPDRAARVDAAGDEVHGIVWEQAARILREGGIPAVLGGDHSTPYGLHQAVAAAHPGVGFLHIDAHADLRDAYLGFRWSHASIFHNTLQLDGVERLVGVGWRDLGSAERERAAHDPRIVPFFDHELARELGDGGSWTAIVDRIVAALPDKVHVSVDIDGLAPDLCPHTGTPVPGGLSWRDFCILLERLADARHVVGFDLVEVNPGPWPLADRTRDGIDAIVGARALYKLAGCALVSQGR